MTSSELYWDDIKHPKIHVNCAENHGPFTKDYYNLKRGMSTKCPKCTKKRSYKGISRALITSLDHKYDAILQRCNNTASPQFKDYGGRGIKCNFQTREDFISYCGRLEGAENSIGSLHLDRIDNNGNYEPGNLRFVTPKTNQRNRRDTRYVEIEGTDRLVFQDWREKYTYLSHTGARCAFAKGYTIQDLPRIPPGDKNQYYRSFRSGELRPKEPFSDLEWIDYS